MICAPAGTGGVKLLLFSRTTFALSFPLRSPNSSSLSLPLAFFSPSSSLVLCPRTRFFRFFPPTASLAEAPVDPRVQAGSLRLFEGLESESGSGEEEREEEELELGMTTLAGAALEPPGHFRR